MDRVPLMRSKFRVALLVAFGMALAGVLATASAMWLNTPPAEAAAPGVTVTTMDGGTSDTTGAAVSNASPSSGGVIPSSGPQGQVDPNSVQMFADSNKCLSCHGDPSLVGLMTYRRPDGSSIALYVDTKGSTNSVHRYKDCTSCHTTKPHEVATPLTKLSLSAKCGTCHDYEYAQWKRSIHGAPQFAGNDDPATCTDCHSATSNPHNVVRVLDPIASTYPKNVAETCAKCHDDPKLMDKYGIVEKVYSSYMRSFHGKAMGLAPQSASLQQLDTATCVSCHGAHNIAVVSDSSAPVAGMDNLLTTCQTCHPDAKPEFVKGFLGHKAANSEYLPEVYWGGKGFFLFTRVMLAGGALIVTGSISLRAIPWVGRKVRRRPKKER